MKLNAKEIKRLSAIKNSVYDDLKIEFLYHSNHLEGSTFTKENLEKLLSLKKVEGEHYLDDVIETKNSLNVFDKVINDSDKKLDKFMLFDWHRELKKDSVDEEIHNTGCWKKYENKLRNIDLKLAYPDEVDSLMFNLLMDWNELINSTIEDIAKFHYRFELIHPFQDGNGRIGRFIILKQCIESDIDLIAIDNEYEKEYKEALYKAQKTDDVSFLVDVFSKCQKRLDEKMIDYKNTIDLVKREIESEDR
ncbi:MAG: Fic family protein [Clostridium sp.]|nr:Fic family protein [Clostridium sp.]